MKSNTFSFSDFQKQSKSDWQEKALKELKGQPLSTYNWSVDGIKLQPYYDASDLPENQAFYNRLLDHDHPSGACRNWDNLQVIKVLKEKQANQEALKALQGGAEGVIFRMDKNFDVATLLNDIDTPYCAVFFDVKGDCNWPEFMKGLKQFQFYRGGIRIEKDRLPIEQLDQVGQNFYWVIKVDEQDDIVSKLSLALLSYLDVVNRATELGKKEKLITTHLGLELPVSTDFFVEIAGLRALRMLVYQLVQAYKVTDFKPEDLMLLARSTAFNEEAYQPHGNMLKSTTAAMAAVLGGSNALTIVPESTENETMVRTARNVSILLKEESYLNKTADPVAGSYYIESLTDKLAEKAWEDFKAKL